MSPNSFLTMDGRFVQSKNPFSSPMPEGENNYFASASAAPSMPSYGYPGSYGGVALLPPRHRHHTTNPLPQFPRKFCFTGSPIPEQQLDMDDDFDMFTTTRTTMPNHSATTTTSASGMAPSGGSLTKVRRFSHDDDIVAASGQAMSTLKAKVAALSVDTSTASVSFAHDPSPTDVLSFPTPPTPVKAKQPRPKTMSHYNNNETSSTVCHYNRIRHSDVPPTTPFMDRRGVGPVDAKTPHPPPPNARRARAAMGSLNNCSSFPSAADASAAASFSRFSNDFDIIGELGHGSFGRVYKVLSRLDGCMYAIKAAQRQAKGNSDRDRMLKEVSGSVSAARLLHT
jgi:hypothetical protein